ncbi:MAG: hypothetical protein ACHQ7M_20490, partial [Chloroflexota bacterium]
QHANTELTALEGERRGLIAFGPHPIFAGLHGGVFLLSPEAGKPYPQAIYTSLTRGRMVAAEWQYLAMDASRRTMLEYIPGAGRVLTVGAHVLFAASPNPYRAFLERFAHNCLAYLAGPAPAEPQCYWPAVDLGPPAGGATGSPGPLPPWTERRDDGALRSTDGQRALLSDGHANAHFDVVGRRVAVVGRHRPGVTEVWSLPLRLARNVRASFDEAAHLVEVCTLPASLQRTFVLSQATVDQTITASPDDAHVAYEITAGALDTVELDFDVDLRWHWPFPEGVMGQPQAIERNGDLLLLDVEGTPRGAVRFVPASSQHELMPASRKLHVRATFAEPKRVVATFRGVWQSSPSPVATRDPLLSIETPDPEFDEQFFWAVNGLRSFDVESPAGRGLVAGWAETGAGWWSGRLGYA